MRIRYSTDNQGRPVKKALVYTKNEHGISKGLVDPDAVRIIERLHQEGFESYIVGGAVRDLLVGKKPKDFDIVTNATPARIKRIFRNSRIIGRRFRLVHVYIGDIIFEVSTFRSIVEGSNGNVYGSIDEDVFRRDFTLNALFYDPREEVIVDYVGGMRDIKKRIIRPIIPLSRIFKEDPVRILRALKYAAMTGFKIPFTLALTIRRDAPLLATVSPSRRTEEIFKIIQSGFSAKIIEKLEKFHVYQYLQPEAARLLKENSEFRKNYYASLESMDGLAKSQRKLMSGELLSFFIRDYLNSIVNWNIEPMEAYRASLSACRSYVLPMNPPRVELENALRLLFREHGLGIKKARTFEKGRNREAIPEPAVAKETIPGEVVKPKRRKRRRKKKSAPVMTSTETAPAI
ncbi:MAG: polynucleotide adenylyltransferase PcnB [Termitinemataceae bacterium]